MRRNVKTVSSVFVAGFLCFYCMVSESEQPKRPFAVADEIGLVHFGDPYTGQAKGVGFSPDGNYFAVCTERGDLNANLVEGSLRFYRSQNVVQFLEHPDQVGPPSPVWIVNRSSKEGPIISQWRWLADSSGVAFLERVARGNQRLVLADLRNMTVELLTSPMEMVNMADVRDRQHYVYTAVDPALRKKVQAEQQASAIVGTGRSLYHLLFPENPSFRSWNRYHLWAVVGGKHFEVKNDGVPLVLYRGDLALSPDGHSLVTTLPVVEVPPSWEKLYPPPFASFPYRIHAGQLDSESGRGSADQYVLIDLRTGSVKALTDAPVSYEAGWTGFGSANWSSDGQEIVLPGTFIRSKDQMPSRPCVAVVDLSSNARTCLESLKSRTETGIEEGYHAIIGSHFEGGDKRQIMVSFYNSEDGSFRATKYERTDEGFWQVAGEVNDADQVGHSDLDLTVKQGLSYSPLLIARNKGASRVIWDPNPQLKEIELGEASVYTWKDKEGRNWRGGLFKPSDYKPGQRYPLVIQTHGFTESEFRPSGLFPTAFAARALAGVGIAVLQVNEGACPFIVTEEGPCAASGYGSAANQLVSEGLVDPERIGIVGFSRSCFYVMETLTFGSIHVKAASITDGVMANYLQYMTFADWGSGQHAREFISMVGAPPFGQGLQQWLKRSPGFNLDKINTPLMVVGEGPGSLLIMWEVYAGLRYLRKPVDLIMLNTSEHVLSSPAMRMASQGGSVDWFRFWLQGYEDPDPTKAEQYRRWRELRNMQQENEKKFTTFQSGSN